VSSSVQALEEIVVVDFSRYLPGAFASRELFRLGARVVHVEPPDGDPLRETAPAWHAALRAGVESVVFELPREADAARRLAGLADVVLESFRPGVADRLGIGRADLPATVVSCSITGFGGEGRHTSRAGHDLNYLGWAGVLEDTAPGWPPVQIADLAAGALGAVTRVLAALIARQQTGTGSHVVVSMTHRSHDLVSHRLGGEPVPRMLTGGLACYRMYATTDARHLTLAALEPKFFRRFCEVVERPELAERQYGDDQGGLADELAAIFRRRPLAEWLDLFDEEDACIGPVWTREEAAHDFGIAITETAPELGAHTDAWRHELSKTE
jgi:alpha-methylacyl-CoA racemase